MSETGSVRGTRPDGVEGAPAGRVDNARNPQLYDEHYYRDYEGGSYEAGGHWTRFFGAISDEIVARWNPRVTLDAGCALGIFVGELRDRGVDAWGVDVSEFAVKTADEQVRPYLRQGSLAEELHPDLPDHFDLVTCIEVLEHMERPDADRAIARLCAVSDRILFSSTPDGYAEPTHFACRPPEEWSAVFARNGFFRDMGADVSFVAPWAVMYVRREWTTYLAVLEYDRVFSRLSEENRQLRSAVVDLDKKASKIDAEVLQAEIERLRAEVRQVRAETAARAADIEAEVQARVEMRMRDTLTWRIGSTITKPAARVRRHVGRRAPDEPGPAAGEEHGGEGRP